MLRLVIVNYHIYLIRRLSPLVSILNRCHSSRWAERKSHHSGIVTTATILVVCAHVNKLHVLMAIMYLYKQRVTEITQKSSSSSMSAKGSYSSISSVSCPAVYLLIGSLASAATPLSLRQWIFSASISSVFTEIRHKWKDFWMTSAGSASRHSFTLPVAV